MKVKFLFLQLLICTLGISLIDIQIFSLAFAQTSDRSFKGNVATFIPPSESERTPKALPSDAISINDLPPVGLEETDEGEGKEKDRDRLPLLTEREIKELPFDYITDLELTDLKIISSKTSFTDPIKRIVEEIIKNDIIISDDNDLNSFNSLKIKNKFDDTHLEQIFLAQNMSQDFETSIGSNETEIISNTNGEQDADHNILSAEDLPNRDILTFINNTKVNSTFTEAEEGQPSVTDELTTGGNVTEADKQSNDAELQKGGKTITIEEIPVQSGESQNEGTTEGNVTIKGPLTVNNNNSKDSNVTTSTELPDEDEQEQIPS